MQLVLDSLRHWVTAYGVAGFRFDLATEPRARRRIAFTPQAAFFQAVAQDPVLARVKMIAEPWDIGAGRLPARRLSRAAGASGTTSSATATRGLLAGRSPAPSPKVTQGLTGSREIFAPVRALAAGQRQLRRQPRRLHAGRPSSPTRRSTTRPTARTTATATATTSRCNYGVEGDTDDPAILALRARQKRNLLATVILAQGVPMLLMGDERSRSQGGNNNAYAQDNATSWMDWDTDPDPQSHGLRRAT